VSKILPHRVRILDDVFIVRVGASLRLGRPGDRIQVGGEIFRTRPARPWSPPSLLNNGYRVFLRSKTAGARL
jgi:hypothetical protein